MAVSNGLLLVLGLFASILTASSDVAFSTVAVVIAFAVRGVCSAAFAFDLRDSGMTLGLGDIGIVMVVVKLGIQNKTVVLCVSAPPCMCTLLKKYKASRCKLKINKKIVVLGAGVG